MEENKETQKETNEKAQTTHPMCVNHPIMKNFVIGVLIFLGAYCAFYTVADWHMKMVLNAMTPMPPHRMERMIMKDMHMMDKMMTQADRKIQRKSTNVIHMEQSKNAYKVFIDLRAFDNNENNVKVSTNGNILTIQGRSIRKSKHNEQISEFQQSYMFGSNVKLSDLTKETEGNYFVITIPIDKTEE